MRVLQVINTLALAGAETLVKDLTFRLQRHGVESHVYVLHRLGSPLEEQLEQAGLSLFGSNKFSVYSPNQIGALTKHLSTYRYDLLHVHLFPAQLWVAIASRALGRQTILITTEHNTYNRRRRWYFRLLDHYLYSRYNQIVCISEPTERALLSWMPSLKAKTYVIPNGIDIVRFATAFSYHKTTLLGMPSELPLVLCVGRLEEQKGHVTLLHAVSRLEGVHLALVGDGPLRKDLETLTIQLGLTQRVHFLGRRTDIPSLLKTADVYVQPSRWEGFGIATLEAMAAGLPVVASNVPGLADVVGNAGMLFPPGDADILAARLKLLIDSPELRSELGKQAKLRAAKYDIESTVEGYLDLYKHMLNL